MLIFSIEFLKRTILSIIYDYSMYNQPLPTLKMKETVGAGFKPALGQASHMPS
jgi:hypothetical protein